MVQPGSIDTLCRMRVMRNKPTVRDTTTGFPAKRRLNNERRNSIPMACHYPDLGSAMIGCAARGIFASTNRKQYPDLGSDASLVWNFCSCFSDVISQGNQW